TVADARATGRVVLAWGHVRRGPGLSSHYVPAHRWDASDSSCLRTETGQGGQVRVSRQRNSEDSKRSPRRLHRTWCCAESGGVLLRLHAAAERLESNAERPVAASGFGDQLGGIRCGVQDRLGIPAWW